MSEGIQKIGFGAVNDEDKSLAGKAPGGKFGLNSGFLTKIEYNGMSGKDNTEGDSVDIHFTVGEKEFRRRIYDVTRVYVGDAEITDTEDAAYIKQYNADISQAMAVVIHAIKAVGVTQAQIEKALIQPPADFASWAKIVTSLVPLNFDKIPVDGFLEYQWEIKGDATMTFLQLPKNMKGGRFFAPGEPGVWTEEFAWAETNEETGAITEHKGLRYVQGDKVHPLTKSEFFMESPKAIQQIDGQEAASAVTGVMAQSGEAKKSTWGK